MAITTQGATDLRATRAERAAVGVLCHGGQGVSWLRERNIRAPCRVVLADQVEGAGPDDPLNKVTMVDRQWDQAAYLAGVLAVLFSEAASGVSGSLIAPITGRTNALAPSLEQTEITGTVLEAAGVTHSSEVASWVL